jgi:hypothetical protein
MASGDNEKKSFIASTCGSHCRHCNQGILIERDGQGIPTEGEG